MNIRHAAVAGTFYPADKKELTTLIGSFYDDASDQPAVGKAIIAPHAGYIYSGEIASSCYAPLYKRRQTITKVILIGPSHYVGFMGMALSGADFFETPLGKIPLDKDLHTAALNCQDTFVLDNAHLQEHSLEVHLPFLQKSLGDFSLLPIVIGQCEPEIVSDLLKALWGGPEILIIISSDLSHYKNYQEAQQADRATADCIVNFQGNELDHSDACGCTPVQGLLLAAQKEFKIKLIDLRNSADTAGGKERVVGYGAFLCDKEKNLLHVFSKQEKVKLLEVARAAIAKPLGIEELEPDCSKICNSKTATFVTLKIDGELRGCIGRLNSSRNLLADIRANAKAAAFEDPRFPPLKASEYNQLEISISILTPPEPFIVNSEEDFLTKVTPGADGIIITEGMNKGTFLPSVWEELQDPQDFLNHLKSKAGLPTDYWSPTLEFQKYSTLEFSEK